MGQGQRRPIRRGGAWHSAGSACQGMGEAWGGGEARTWLASSRQGSSPKAALPWQLNMRASTLPLGSARTEVRSFQLSVFQSTTFLSSPAARRTHPSPPSGTLHHPLPCRRTRGRSCGRGAAMYNVTWQAGV